MYVPTATTHMRRLSTTIVNMCVMCALHNARHTLVELKSAVSAGADLEKYLWGGKRGAGIFEGWQ